MIGLSKPSIQRIVKNSRKQAHPQQRFSACDEPRLPLDTDTRLEDHIGDDSGEFLEHSKTVKDALETKIKLKDSDDYVTCVTCGLRFLLTELDKYVEHKQTPCTSNNNSGVQDDLLETSMQDPGYILSCCHCSLPFASAYNLLLHCQIAHDIVITHSLSQGFVVQPTRPLSGGSSDAELVIDTNDSPFVMDTDPPVTSVPSIVAKLNRVIAKSEAEGDMSMGSPSLERDDTIQPSQPIGAVQTVIPAHSMTLNPQISQPTLLPLVVSSSAVSSSQTVVLPASGTTRIHSTEPNNSTILNALLSLIPSQTTSVVSTGGNTVKSSDNIDNIVRQNSPAVNPILHGQSSTAANQINTITYIIPLPPSNPIVTGSSVRPLRARTPTPTRKIMSQNPFPGGITSDSSKIVSTNKHKPVHPNILSKISKQLTQRNTVSTSTPSVTYVPVVTSTLEAESLLSVDNFIPSSNSSEVGKAIKRQSPEGSCSESLSTSPSPTKRGKGCGIEGGFRPGVYRGCPHCVYKTVDRSNMRRHIKKRHPEEAKYLSYRPSSNRPSVVDS